MTRILTVLAFLAGLGTAAAEDPAFVRPPTPAKISLSVAQTFSFLDGGYADAAHYYSFYWDTGQTWSARASMDLLPVLRAGLSLGVREFEDRGFGIDDLHTGHARLLAGLRLPLTLPARFLDQPDALASVRGPVAFLHLEAGLGVIDPTSDAFGGFFDRTFTYSTALVLGLEYRLEQMGLFVSFGAEMLGPPKSSAGFSAEPDLLLTFPLTLGVSLYLP